MIYDNSFTGLLTAIFEVFEYRLINVDIVPYQQFTPTMFSKTQKVVSNYIKSERVIKRLEQQLGKYGINKFITVYLSKDLSKEKLILDTIKHAIKHHNKNILNDFSHPSILNFNKLYQSVTQETHKMKGFVRFELLKNNLYFAKITPDYNILPLIKAHFQKRFQDQKWLIFDLYRQYGIIIQFREYGLHTP